MQNEVDDACIGLMCHEYFIFWDNQGPESFDYN